MELNLEPKTPKRTITIKRKIERHLAYIESKVEEYNNALSTADQDQKEELNAKIDKQNLHKSKYQKIENQLKESGETQISTSDPKADN